MGRKRIKKKNKIEDIVKEVVNECFNGAMLLGKDREKRMKVVHATIGKRSMAR